MVQKKFQTISTLLLVLLAVLYGVFLGKEKSLEKKLTHNNIYKKDREWTYKGTFLDKNGVPKDSQRVVLTVTGKDFFGQTGIKYKYLDNEGKKLEWETTEGKDSYGKTEIYSRVKEVEETGVIEGPDKVWIHPPRSLGFRFTELTAFPEIHKPFREGKEWTGVLSIGKGWGKWEGIEVQQHYKIAGQKDIAASMMNFTNCWQIDATAESKEGIYRTTFYFHDKYGFVKWEYTRPDSSKVILDLEKISRF